MSSDSPELEALFDSIANAAAAPGARAAGEDTPELESLFDSMASAVRREEMEQAGAAEGTCPERIFAQLGQMTRNLHNLLRELGLDQTLTRVASDLPDHRDRLKYIASMTAQAAERTLNAAERAQPIAEDMGQRARRLADEWDRLFNRELGVAEFKALVQDTRRHLADTPAQSAALNAQLMEIILAQDFQDLTGQVIKKVLDAAQQLEHQLVGLLLETTPEDRRQAVAPGLLNGPVINAAGRSDVVTSQAQVDDLLESLGF